MKKFLAILLVVVMMFSVVACKQNSGMLEGPLDKNVPSSNDETPEKTPEELQAYYNEYFNGGDLKIFGNSIVANTEGLVMKLVSLENGETLFETAVGENVIKLYKQSEENQYVYIKMTLDGQTVDGWYKYVETTDVEHEQSDDIVVESSESIFESFSSELDLADITDFGQIMEVKYEKTENGIDYVTIKSLQTDEYEESYEIVCSVGVNSETNEIVSISEESDGVVATVTFEKLDKIDYDVSSELEEITDEEIMSYYFAMIFSMMETDIEE